MEFFGKKCNAIACNNGTLISYCIWISLITIYTLKYGESPNTDANIRSIMMILQPIYLLDLKTGL